MIRTATSRALRQMQELGLIERSAGHGDGRTRRVVLTDLGRDRLEKGEPVARGNNQKLAERLGDDTFEDLKGKLDLIIEGEPALPNL